MIKKTQTSQFMKLICWLTFSLSRSCQTFESCGTVIFFFYFTYFYTTYITHVNNKYTVIYLQICLEWTLAFATVHQKEHTMYRYYYISSIIAKGFLSATLLNNDPLVPIRNPCQAKIIQVLQAINIMLFLAHTHKLQMIFPVQIINVVT